MSVPKKARRHSENYDQGSLRELELEEALRSARHTLRYATNLLCKLLYEEDIGTVDFFEIRLAEIDRTLNPSEETERAVQTAIETARKHDMERAEQNNAEAVKGEEAGDGGK